MTAGGRSVPPIPSCHSGPARGWRPGTLVVALAGAPNVGKSTLFNALTGARRTVGNWPGTTVEVECGTWPARDTECSVVDLPGTYSLDPTSPDEELTRTLLLEEDPADRPDLVMVAVDAAHLSRSLYLVAQLREHPYRLVVVLTMSDVAGRRGVTVDPVALERSLGVSVVAVDPRRRTGVDALADVVRRTLDSPEPGPRAVGPTDDDDLAVADERFGWIAHVVDESTARPASPRRTWSDRVDRWAMSPVAGPLLVLATMFVVFQVTTTVAGPLQDALGAFFSGPVTDATSATLDAVGLGDSWLHGLLVEGIVAGVGTLLTFVPLMALMFLLLSLLEDSGYMARAAVVTDRLMHRIGLPGRAFLPLIVGFGCNVPAISATRVLPDARQRVLTALLVPFTSCSARLTVYVLVATTFFPDNAGVVVFAMYVLSIALVVLIGLVLRSTLWRTMGSEPLMLDLPPYQRPTVAVAGLGMWVRLKGFLQTAGGIIVVAVSVVWLLQATPVTSDAEFGRVPPQDSLYAATAQGISPVFEPTGFGTWELSSALLVGFVAKEAVVSSWAQTYAAADGEQPRELSSALRADFDDSSGGHTLAAVWAFLVFLLAYTPCVATLAAQRREIGLRWTAFGVAVQLSVAWLLAVAVFQVGRMVS